MAIPLPMPRPFGIDQRRRPDSHTVSWRRLPNGVMKPRQPVNTKCLRNQDANSDLDHCQVLWFGNDPEGNNKSGRPGRRMARIQQNHDGSSSGRIMMAAVADNERAAANTGRKSNVPAANACEKGIAAIRNAAYPADQANEVANKGIAWG